MHRIKNDLDVPEDWIVTEPDKEISGLQCPSIYDHVKPKNVSFVFIFKIQTIEKRKKNENVVGIRIKNINQN